MTSDAEQRLADLGLRLPEAPAAAANYVPYLIAGDLLMISGQISKTAEGTILTGQLGQDLNLEQGIMAAQICALNILAQAKTALGTLDKVSQVLRLTGFVASPAGFFDQAKVINGASDLMVAVFGDRGRHTRSAVGVSALPMNAAVEIDAMIRIG